MRFKTAPDHVGNVPIKSLVEFDARLYDTWEECRDAEGADLERNIATERVRM